MTKEYKQTLNLPQTDFPMKANLVEQEPRRLTRWQGLYERQRALRKDAPKFILHDGPPYANGHIHLGHALNKVLKDIVMKSRALSGYDTPYVPGWDCHGLPIEVNVEKKIGKPGHKVSAKEFRAACRAYAAEQIAIQREEFKRLGILGDWDHPYLTMDFKFEADVMRSLARILEQGYVRRGFKPVYWCVDCASALAEAEVEYALKTSLAIDVRFSVVDETLFLSHFKNSAKISGPIAVPIWTTTPWTLPANEAVALNAEIDYALVQCTDECLLIAKELVPVVMARYGYVNFKIIAECKGADLEHSVLQHPFYDKQVPIILGDHVTVNDGTGAVHTAPAHGVEDYHIGVRYHLKVESPVQPQGTYAEDLPLFGGRFVRSVDADIIEVLRKNKKLLKEVRLEHSYPHCWRHKTPLIFRATPQWFIALNETNLKDNCVHATKSVQWVPAQGSTRMLAMLNNRPDWCISRQRTWGVPIPFVIHKVTGELHPDILSIIEIVAKKVEQAGIDVWYDLSLAELTDDHQDYIFDRSVLDVWFDSGVTHFCVLKQRVELQYPADVYLEGADQHRGWFQSSLLTSVAMSAQAPYKAVLTHGFTVDDQGRKMSKSLGNVIPPEKIIKTLGADMLRLWVASTDYQGDMSLSEEILKRTTDTYRRLRNTARFLLSNLDDFNPATDCVPYEHLISLDRFALALTYRTQIIIQQAYVAYDFHIAYQTMLGFCINDMGNFYLDIIKDRQYTAKKATHARRSAQTVMYHMAHALCRWLAPICSFTADEIWDYLPGTKEDSVFLSTWYEELSDLSATEKMGYDFWQRMIAVRNAVNKEIERLRNDKQIGSALEADVALYADGALYQDLIALKDELRFVLITSSTSVQPLAQAPTQAVNTESDGLKLYITASPHTKCVRCWQRRADVGVSAEDPELCGRCVVNVTGEGEERAYA